MFTRLLVVLDRTRVAEGCIDVAVAIARASDADLELVCITAPEAFPASHTTGAANAPALDEEYLRNIAGRVIEAGFERVFHRVLLGDPATVICAHARTTRADLLVLASHERTGPNQTASRRMAEELVRHAGIPVLEVRDAAGKGAPLIGPPFVRRVLVTLDGSELAKTVLPTALALAGNLGAELHLLRVVQPVQTGAEPLTDTPETARQIKEASTSLEECTRTLDRFHAAPIFRHVVTESDIAAAIVEFSSAHDINIIALASRGGGRSRLIVGSVADHLLSTCDLPVLTLHAGTLVRPASPPAIDREHELV